MLDSCSVKRVSGSTVDPGTGEDTPTYTALYGTDEEPGRCKVQTFEAFEQTPEAVGHQFTVQRYAVHVPVGSFAPAIGDLVTIAEAAMDENLTGRVFRVVALLHKTAATAYRLGVTDEVA